jgi:hypothetical protein
MIHPENNKKEFHIKHEVFWLLVLVVLSLIIHGMFVIDGFGESDAARLAIQVAGWHHMGEIAILNYTVRTSPLYLHLLKFSLDIGFPIQKVPALLNWTNVVMGSLTLIPMFFLWKKLSNSVAAIVGCLFYSATPTFGNANVAGMPHLPSFSFFITSLLLFLMSIEKVGWKYWAFSIGSLVFGILAIELKADIILCFGAYLGISLINKRKIQNIIFSFIVPLVSLLVVTSHTKLISPVLPAASHFTTTWIDRWPIVLHRNNLIIPVVSVGAVFFSLTCFAILFCLIRKKHLRILFLCLIWSLPAILFWSLREGNSIRHMMVPFSIITFFLAVVLTYIPFSPKTVLFIGLILIFANYFISPDPANLKSIRGRLIKNTIKLQEQINQMRSAGREFAEISYPQKILAGSNTIPHVLWESVVKAKQLNISWNNTEGIWGENLIIFLEMDHNLKQVIKIKKIVKKPIVIIREPGWRTWTCEKGIIIE